MGNLKQNREELFYERKEGEFRVGDLVKVIKEDVDWRGIRAKVGAEFIIEEVGTDSKGVVITEQGNVLKQNYRSEHLELLEAVEFQPNSALTKAIKETQGKVTYQDIDWDFFDAISNRMDENKDKYPIGNWKKDMDINEIARATIRHCRKILQPINNDPETTLEHSTAIGCNAMFLHYHFKNK